MDVLFAVVGMWMKLGPIYVRTLWSLMLFIFEIFTLFIKKIKPPKNNKATRVDRFKAHWPSSPPEQQVFRASVAARSGSDEQRPRGADGGAQG